MTPALSIDEEVASDSDDAAFVEESRCEARRGLTPSVLSVLDGVAVCEKEVFVVPLQEVPQTGPLPLPLLLATPDAGQPLINVDEVAVVVVIVVELICFTYNGIK